MDKWERIDSELLQLKNGSLFRKMTVFDSAQTAVVTIEGKKQHLFSSNSYLDLSSEPRIKEYAGRILNEYGAGSGGSRLTTGTTRIHMELEQAIAAFKNREAALVFNTGYMANVGILSALTQKGDIIYSDQLNHASIIDGCRLSKADLVVYRHNDMDDLEEKIKAHPGKRGIIVSDGVFSMDGDIVNLPRLTELAGRYGLLSMIDEAHATGVIGATGRGTEEYLRGRHAEIAADVFFRIRAFRLGDDRDRCAVKRCNTADDRRIIAIQSITMKLNKIRKQLPNIIFSHRSVLFPRFLHTVPSRCFLSRFWCCQRPLHVSIPQSQHFRGNFDIFPMHPQNLRQHLLLHQNIGK